MCGLAAIYNYSGQFVDPQDLERMTHVLTRRGPDDYGFCFAGAGQCLRWREQTPPMIHGDGVAMGHRRLRIIDLSEAGRQPFESLDGRYWIVHNGEVYNYIELRNELKGLGHDFQSGTDTEVVLNAYIQWGTACFNRFNGMWALLIWDSKQRTLVACRDRFGIKPLYYQHIDGAILFASEAKAILQHPLATRAPDVASVVRYLARHTAPTEGASFFAGIRAVKPASWMMFKANRPMVTEQYWRLPEDRVSSTNVDAAASKLKELLSDSVRLRLRSDVKLGTMLSGGLDSTSIIALVDSMMRKCSMARTATGDFLHSFTASFPGLAIDESKSVDELCTQFSLIKHNVIPLRENNILSLLKGTVYSMEMPWLNSVPLVHSLLMRKAQAEGVKVVLCGHGSDEVFAGYPSQYCPMAVADAFLGLRWRRAKRELDGMRRVHRLATATAIRAIRQRLLGDVKQFLGQGETWTAEELVNKDLLRQFPSPTLKQRTAASGLDRLLRTHFFESMLPGWLQMEDRISMANSVESRLPFMDHRLIEYGFSLSDDVKIRDGQTKVILRKAMSGELPQTIVENSKKTPFSGPDTTWLASTLRAPVEELLFNGDPCLTEFVDPVKLKSLQVDFANGQVSMRRVWTLLTTEIWLRTYFRESIDATHLV